MGLTAHGLTVLKGHGTENDFVIVPDPDAALTLTSQDAAEAARLLGVSRVVGLHTEDWEHFSESRAQLEAAFAGTGLLVATPRGVPTPL